MKEIKNRTNEANEIVKHYAKGAVGVGIVPLPLLDLALLSGIQLSMIHRLAQLYKVQFSENLAQPAIAALLGSTIPVSFSLNLASFVKGVSGYGLAVGMASTALFGSASTYAVGKVFIQHFESGGTLLNFDPQQVKDYYAEQFEKNEEQMRKSFAGIRP
ncbi:MAG: YcjF family protein [Ardenticatenaceae bacterium]